LKNFTRSQSGRGCPVGSREIPEAGIGTEFETMWNGVAINLQAGSKSPTRQSLRYGDGA
jgi:hypothetical protein